MQDIAGCRPIVDDMVAQGAAVLAISQQLTVSRIYDLRSAPHSGYRAVHMIALANNGASVEIQVRTEIQEMWARWSEKLADRHGLELKYGGGDPAIREGLDRISDYGWQIEGLSQAPGIDASPADSPVTRQAFIEAAREGLLVAFRSWLLDDVDTTSRGD